jgi:fido (protein-threonine AMPylation protein)
MEMVARFHHRLVFIHPFPNGNGRLSRVMADLLAERLGEKRSAWGASDLQQMSEIRHRYISALKKADRGNYEKLIKFVAGDFVL